MSKTKNIKKELSSFNKTFEVSLTDIIADEELTQLSKSGYENGSNGDFFINLFKDIARVSLKMASNCDEYKAFNFHLTKDIYDSSIYTFCKKFLEIFNTASNRVKPLDFVITGEAGVGKTAFVNALKNNYSGLKDNIYSFAKNAGLLRTDEIMSDMPLLDHKPDEGGLVIFDIKDLKNIDKGKKL